MAIDELKAFKAVKAIDEAGFGPELEALATQRDPAEAVEIMKSAGVRSADQDKVRAAIRILGGPLAKSLLTKAEGHAHNSSNRSAAEPYKPSKPRDPIDTAPDVTYADRAALDRTTNELRSARFHGWQGVKLGGISEALGFAAVFIENPDLLDEYRKVVAFVDSAPRVESPASGAVSKSVEDRSADIVGRFASVFGGGR